MIEVQTEAWPSKDKTICDLGVVFSTTTARSTELDNSSPQPANTSYIRSLTTTPLTPNNLYFDSKHVYYIGTSSPSARRQRLRQRPRSQLSRRQEVSNPTLTLSSTPKSPTNTHLRPAPRKAKVSRGDGKTAQTAYWSDDLWRNCNQPQYLVHRRTNELPNRWVRTTFEEARFDAQTGFTVWHLDATGGRRVNLAAGPSQFQPFQATYTEIEREEQRRVAEREYLPGDEDILDGE